MMKLGVFAIALVATQLVACSSKAPVGCVSPSECPAGHVCIDNACQQLCDTHESCARGMHCESGLCVAGDPGGAPVIASLGGSSTAPCTDVTGASVGRCIGTGFRVTGHNLFAAQWTLVGGEGQGSFDLVPSGQTDTGSTLTPSLGGAQDLEGGLYSLFAANAAGTTQVAVQLLEGDAGPQGPKGDPGDSGLGAQLYVYDNATVPAISERPVERMVVRLNAPVAAAAGGPYDDPTALPVDDAPFWALCADADGCTLTLGTTGWVVGGRTMRAPYTGGPCRFFLTTHDGQRHWAVDESCTVFHALKDVSTGCPNGECPTLPGFYARYFSARFGIDGDAPTAASDTSHLVLNFERTCALAESAPDATTPGGYQPDDASGFFLIASSPSWGPSDYPPLASWPPASNGRACVLIVDD